MDIDGLSIGSNSKNIVAPQCEKSLIQQEPSKTHQEPPYRILTRSCVQLYGVGQQATIGSLPDNVLLDIFDFYQVVINTDFINEHPWNWEKLVHVCRRWRSIIFESPIRLNLQLFCTGKSPVRKLLDVWPPFPLIIRFTDYSSKEGKPQDCIGSTADLIATLERRDRVREIKVHLTFPPVHLPQRIFTAMEKPFPALRSLQFSWPIGIGENILPDILLNGSAPCLRILALRKISFPSLPQLLSSTSDLTYLSLEDIPDSGYIPPETMATSLSALPNLRFLRLFINFKLPTPHPERRNRAPPLQTRFVLPALTCFDFKGGSEYLEVLAARLEAPVLNISMITYFHQPVFDIQQTVRFRVFSQLDSFRPSSLTLSLESRNGVFISFLSDTTHHSKVSPILSWKILCEESDRQLISAAQICGQILPSRSSVKLLTITCNRLIDDPNPTLWLQLFHSVPSVQILQIPVVLEPSIASALGRPMEESLAVAEVFPSLQSLYIVGNKSGETVQRPIQSFVADRQRSGRPVAVSRVDSI
jgi:F-box-like